MVATESHCFHHHFRYQDPGSSSFLQNFAIIYVKMGFQRADAELQQQLLPQLVAGLAGKPQQHRDQLMVSNVDEGRRNGGGRKRR